MCRRGFGLRANIHRRKSGGSGHVRVVPRGMPWTYACVWTWWLYSVGRDDASGI